MSQGAKRWAGRVLVLVLSLVPVAAGAASWGEPPPDPERPWEKNERYTPPAPTRWYLGIGASQGAISSNYDAIGSQRAGGTDLVGGLEFARTWSAEMYVSFGQPFDTQATSNIYYPPDQASYALLALSLRKRLWDLDQRGWSPWLGLGIGVGGIEWETYFYNLTGGWTPAYSGGVDVALGKLPLALRLQWLRNSFTARDTYDYGPYRVTATITSAMILWRFR